MTHKVSITLLVASFALSLLAACSSTPAAPAVALSDAEIQAISMPIAQNIITSLADED
ncbi:MAG TPA: hypothetical protein P5184_10180 [Bacteroidales bacterium]|nr:hypothetical protein [Bacteroidales bacterium]